MPVAVQANYPDDDPNLLFLRADRVRWGDPGLSRRYAERVKQLVASLEPANQFRFGPELAHLEGLLAIKEGDPDSGLRQLETAFAQLPEAIGHADDLAQLYLQRGRTQNALDVIALKQ